MPPQSGTPWVPLYQGNGRFGSCFGPWGLHLAPRTALREASSSTVLMHMRHQARAKFNSDYLLPLGRLYWDEEPHDVRSYRQHQSFAEGTITTQFATAEGSITVTTWFDPIRRDLMGCEIFVQGRASDVLFSPMLDLQVHYGQSLTAACDATLSEGLWQGEIRCLNARSTVFLRTDAAMRIVDGGVQLSLAPGRNVLVIGVSEMPAVSAPDSLAQTRDWWRAAWERGLWLDLPDDAAHKMWVRSTAYFLSTFNDDGLGFPPPMGLSGNGWPFNFPQDVSYIHPVLLAAGQLPTAQAWVERFAGDLKGLRDYTRRLLNVEGILCPWTYPHGSFEGYHVPTPPNQFFYETHNSGYLCRMAHETAVMVNDPSWTHDCAVPLIGQTAAFYAAICRKGRDGLWHLHVTPSMGQDEMGGANQEDYLCALFSAQYCFQCAIAHGLDTGGRYAAILRDGLAFASLLSEQGIYHTCGGSGARDLGKQKHPPQLNALAFLPVSGAPDAPAQAAYRLRYAITDRAAEPFFHGWTLGEFLLAGARLGDVRGWRHDWAQALPAGYVDPDWIQIFESSRSSWAPFYTTTHGLFTQAIIETLASTWWGGLDLAPCFVWDGAVRFGNLRTLLGVTLDGTLSPTGGCVTATAWKDAAFLAAQVRVSLRKGERRELVRRRDDRSFIPA